MVQHFNRILAIVLFVNVISLQSQQFTLEKCLDMAVNNHPLAKKVTTIQKLSGLENKNIQSYYYPELVYNAQASYQDPVLEVDLNTNGATIPFKFPSPGHDQYKTWVEVRQNIYDGGMVHKKMEIEQQGSKAELVENEVSIDKIKSMVCDLYFAILLAEKQLEQLGLTLEDLNKKLETTHALVQRGTVLQSNYNGLYAEILKLEQQITLMQNQKNTAVGSLKIIMGNPGIDLGNISLPVYSFHRVDSIHKKEHELFKASKTKLDLVQDLYSFQRRPVVFAFSQVGYGNPGLNMLNDSFEPYYIIGAGLKWDITDWNRTKRNMSKQEIQKGNIDIMRDQFDRQLNISIEKTVNEIDAYEKLIASDEKIISTCHEIAQTAFSQFQNGTINSAEYILEMNKEKQAILSREINKIRKLQAIVNYYLLTGEL